MLYEVDPDSFAGPDHEKIQAAIDSVPWSISDPLLLKLRRHYVLDEGAQVLVAPQGATGSVFIDARGGKVTARSSASGNPFTFGTSTHKIWWSEVDSLDFGDLTPIEDKNHSVRLQSTDCVQFKNCRFSVIGESTPTTMPKYISMQNCFFGGSPRDGFAACDLRVNVADIANCKFQQSNVGLRLNGTSISVRAIDVSHTDSIGIHLVNVDAGSVQAYTEINYGVTVRMDDCQGTTLNVRTGNHCDYAVDLNNSHQIALDGGCIYSPIEAGLRIASNCSDIEWRPSCAWLPHKAKAKIVEK